MKKFIPFIFLFGFVFAAILTGCQSEADTKLDPIPQDNPDDKKPENAVPANEYFWGTWVRMDNGTEYDVLDGIVVQGEDRYIITASDESTLSVNSLGTFEKESDSVMVCKNIPYFRKGGANLEYTIKLVGFKSSSRQEGTQIKEKSAPMQNVEVEATADNHPEFVSRGISDENGDVHLTATNAKDSQNLKIPYEDDFVVVTGLKVHNSGDYMGTVALVGKDDYNLKITGTISEDQKDNGYLYGNNAKTYKMEVTITNVSENKSSPSSCSIMSADKKLSISIADDTIEDLEGIPIITLVPHATKDFNLELSYGEMSEPYVDTGLIVTIENPSTNQTWEDYIPLRFFKGTIPITVAAKNPENNSNAALNGFIMYPDGNNQFFAIKHNDCKPVFVPTFGKDKPYKLVFSGATVSAQLSDSTEMYYTVEPASINPRPVITSGGEIVKYISFGGDNHTEDTPYIVTQGFESYLSEGERDYYSIAADSDEYYGPGGSVFYSVSYENAKGNAPDTILAPEGAVLSTIQLPEMDCNGYKFLGWYSGTTKVTPGVYKVSNDVTFTAKWQIESYSVIYELNGGKNSAANPSTYTVESELITLKTPMRIGYDFDGWFATETLSGTAVENIGGGATGDLKLYAKWNPVSYTITYNLDGGKNVAANPISYTIESNTITFAEPEKNGFIFGGWFTADDFSGTKQTEITNGSTGNKTYYAKWLKKCTVSFVTAYSTAPDSIIAGEGEKLTAEQLPILTCDEYFFSGWYDGESRATAGSYTVTDNVTLTAKWSDKCNVSYVTLHGTVPQAFDVEKGTTLTASNLPALKESGWKFLGWYLNSSYDEDKKASAGQSVTTSITLYAKWEEYTVTDDGFVFVEGGTVVGSDDYNQYSTYTGAFPAGRTVTLSSFYMCDHEVTQKEYETYCCYTDISNIPSSSYGVGTNYPVYYVSWYDAIVFCNLKSITEGLTPCYALRGETNPKKWTGIKSSNGKYSCSYTSANSTWDSITCDMTANGYRLPTETEWEYAARGGQKTYGTAAFANYFAGASTTNYSASSNNDLDPVGWYKYNICNDGVTGSEAISGNEGYGTHEVKKKSPNALGLYDMSGNVWEWCWDWYSSSVGSGIVNDPCGASSGSYRVRRGGCWGDIASNSSVSCRSLLFTYHRGIYYGFRLVRTSVYTITYESTYGDTPRKTGTRDSITSEQLPQLSADGCIFKGWYDGDNLVTDGYEIIGDITLTAKWEFENYSINYYLNGGKRTPDFPVTYTIEQGANLMEPTYSGKTFAGWFLDSNFTTKITKIEPGTTGDITLYARWGEAGTVTVTFPEYNDITMTYTENGNYITFTGPEDYVSYEWQIDGSKMLSNKNTLTVNISNWSSGRHIITLTVEKNGSKRNATVTITK